MVISPINLLIELLALSVLLLLSFLFSGSEVAFLSISPRALERDKRLSPIEKDRIRKLISDYTMLIGSILLANTAVNSFASTIFTALSSPILNQLNLPESTVTVFEIGVFTILLLILGEVTPKLIAMNDPISFSRKTASLINNIVTMFGKFTVLLNLAYKIVSPQDEKSEKEQEGEQILDEIFFMVQRIKEEKLMDEEEAYFVMESLFLLRAKVGDVMIPLKEIPMLPTNASVAEAVETMTHHGLDFVLIYDKSIDHIVGAVTPESIMETLLRDGTGESKVSEAKIEVNRILTSMPLSSVWKKLFRDGKAQPGVFLVIDEYGDTEGVVTFKSLLDMFSKPSIKARRTEEGFIVDGDLRLYELGMILGVKFDVENTSVAGYLMMEKQGVPQKGENIVYQPEDDDFEVIFTVLETEDGVIKRVKVEKRPRSQSHEK